MSHSIYITARINLIYTTRPRWRETSPTASWMFLAPVRDIDKIEPLVLLRTVRASHSSSPVLCQSVEPQLTAASAQSRASFRPAIVSYAPFSRAVAVATQEGKLDDFQLPMLPLLSTAPRRDTDAFTMAGNKHHNANVFSLSCVDATVALASSR